MNRTVKAIKANINGTPEELFEVVNAYVLTTLSVVNAENELKEFEAYQKEIQSKEYKYLCVPCKDGHNEYYTIISISFSKFQIDCKHFKGNKEDIMEDKVLYRDDVKCLALKIHR